MITDMASRLTSRVAPYLSAIAKARAAGLTWRDLGQRFGVNHRRLQWAVTHCKYVADQVDLPDPTPAPSKTVPRREQRPTPEDQDDFVNKNLIP